MSENVYDEAGITKGVCSDTKESMVDICVSAESLRVYENPWVVPALPNVPGPARSQQPVFVVRENSPRRRSRSDSVFQCAVYLLLLAVIVALICLGVQMKKDRSEMDQLLAKNANLRNVKEQLKANNITLSKQIDRLQKQLREQRKKCRDCPGKTGSGKG